MTILPPTFSVGQQPEQAQLESFLDEHRATLRASLDGLSDEQARRVVVPSGTTLLSLLKHGTFLEQVWFDEAITHRSRAQLGIPDTGPESFALSDADTPESVTARYDEVCAASRATAAAHGLDEVMTGSRHGDFTLRWIYLHMLRERAEHSGHADILREVITS